jgi:hypothetical protein
MGFHRGTKIEALFTLMEYSLIIPEEMKVKIQENIVKFSDEDIMNMGMVLSYEHDHRKELDRETLQIFISHLNRSIQK